MDGLRMVFDVDEYFKSEVRGIRKKKLWRSSLVLRMISFFLYASRLVCSAKHQSSHLLLGIYWCNNFEASGLDSSLMAKHADPPIRK